MNDPEGDATSPTVLLSERLGDTMRARLAPQFPHVRFSVLPADGAVPEDARDAEVLFRAGMPHEALRTALGQAPGLRWIHTASAGFNWVLIPEVAASEIRLTRTAHAVDVPIAEFVLATALSLLKRLPAFRAAQGARTWSRDEPVERLEGKTVGIIGAGAIGRAAAARFRAFDTTVIGMKRAPAQLPEFHEVVGPDGLDRLLREADVLVLACPLTPETRHLLDAAAFRAMKPSAILINIARGAVAVEADLFQALRTGEIAAAALDVFETEPLPEDSPLWGMDNVLITPHVSYLGPGNESAIAEEFAENLRRYQKGEPLRNEIKSRELGY